MLINPVHGIPALTVKIGGERAVLVADLHLGIEGELTTKGVSLPSQIPRIRDRLVELIEKKKPDRLIMLGDVKHNVPIASWREWRELPSLFETLSRLVRVEVIPGNHDGDLRGMIPESVRICGVKGIVLGKKKRIGLSHGHAWPGPELFKTEWLICGHNHPAVEFKDKLGARTVEPVWLKAELEPSKLPKSIRTGIEGIPPRLLVIPAFGELVGGAPVNKAMPKELIGPLFKAGAVKLRKARAYLLDGTFLGEVGKLKKTVS